MIQSIASAHAGPNSGPAAQVSIANITGSAVTAYLGHDKVSTTTGYPLAQNTSIQLTLYPGDVLYAVSGSSATLAILQT